MRALVLERKGVLALRDIDLPQSLGADDVRIKMHTVGICGSDVHYYVHGEAGPCVVREPMVLGHEASGTIIEVGSNVTTLKAGDRVCMEPGIPDFKSKASKLGKYNVDPSVVFWATPPVHGCLTESVVHPAAFTFKIPDNVSFGEAAMVEPFAVGMQAAVKARITPGDVAIVLGAGTIGIMIALAALAGGCSKVLITDVHQPKLDIAGQYEGIVPINIAKTDAKQQVLSHTDGWGANIVFEASGASKAIASLVDLCGPGGTIVLVGVPVHENSLDVAGAINKEVEIRTVFRYANVFDRALNLIASGKVNLKPLISQTFAFEESVTAFERAASGQPSDVKLQIKVSA
ncbi:NAD(P)-dependent alcohol dehydrogenase [Rhizobium anhuiense]|uniref:NAD(P)-dependent alcohol dehydrogenase n=1 Tax=Rhizobium anhuiense TaxID=1184720 RepID=UPI000BEA64D7|nr:NAD(P)-dependent alcohol dehydrogenase [Rhizobium anhuiense]PDS63060.1 NAD(P)-dependent alcohol dehydrogenase [Rhizobium anhuiense]